MVINTNMAALTANRTMNANAKAAASASNKLSTGYRINGAADDAAGLAISEKMESQIRGLEQASRNASDGISLVQTAEGALAQTTDIIQRMRELSVQASSDTYTTEDRASIQLEINQLASEITRIAEETEFNGMGLLNGNKTDLAIQVGANAGQQITVSLQIMTADELQIDALVVSNAADANEAISSLDAALKTVSDFRASLGAKQNRLEYTITNVDNTAENLTSAQSTLRDADMAATMVEFSKYNVLQQAAQSMLSQANSNQQNVLSLLR